MLGDHGLRKGRRFASDCWLPAPAHPDSVQQACLAAPKTPDPS